MVSRPISSRALVAGPLWAAEYVRMSTEGQQYSIDNQQAAIRQYARERHLTIIRTYADRGKSGLSLEGRDGLAQLLADVQSGQSDFDVVLVYDVSRWGRFQDTDEGGYYEYLCRRAGVRVEYCVEPFENDGGPLATIFKNIKRAMAAEYSREQSSRVHSATCRAALLGHFTGGSPPYGFRRVLVGADGGLIGVLQRGVYRSIRSDYMVLAPGPSDEVNTVRRIFQLYTSQRLSPQAIADRLNKEGKSNSHGRPWRDEVVWAMLRNEKYVGTNIYNMRSRRLRTGPRHKNDAAKLVRVIDAFPGIVSPTIFAAAQARLHERRHREHSEESLLGRLQYLLKTHGYLSVALIRADAQPDIVVYQRRFGSIREAYARIDYVSDRDRSDAVLAARVAAAAKVVVSQFIDAIRATRARVDRRWPTGLIVIDGVHTAAVKMALYFETAVHRQPRWELDFVRKSKPDWTLLVRMDRENAVPMDFFLLPKTVIKRRVNLGGSNLATYEPYWCPTVCELVVRLIANLSPDHNQIRGRCDRE